MLQVKRIDDHGLGQLKAISNPIKRKSINFGQNRKGLTPMATHHMVEQSKLVSNHLLGLVLNDMAYSIPFIRYLNSGQIIALPAYAASTCSQVPASLAIGPISAKLSKETHEVVPKVADTKKGTNPIALSSSMAYKQNKHLHMMDL